jgi:hypothetical protein
MRWQEAAFAQRPELAGTTCSRSMPTAVIRSWQTVLHDEGPSANVEPRMLSDDASRQPVGRRRAVANTTIAGAPIAAAKAWASHEKRHAECDQQERADEVKHANGDEAKVLGDAE